VLEDLWAVEVPPLRDYYKGLIQIAVAVCHWERGNGSGARGLYRSGMDYLAVYPEDYESFALGEFRDVMAGFFAPLLATPKGTTPAFPGRDKLPVLRQKK